MDFFNASPRKKKAAVFQAAAVREYEAAVSRFESKPRGAKVAGFVALFVMPDVALSPPSRVAQDPTKPSAFVEACSRMCRREF